MNNYILQLIKHEIAIAFDILEQERQAIKASFAKSIPDYIQRIAGIFIILLLLPILILTMIAIRLESKGSVIFTQIRVGKDGRRFKMYKFRSMYTADDPRYISLDKLKSDRDGICLKIFNDPRITKVGKVIRKLSIDELPQLINVIIGDMLLVGPRPALVSETDKYEFFMLERLNVKPGLTGLWQVMGRADLDFEQQIALDIKYVRETNFWMDVKILFATVPAVITGKGAY